MTSRGPALPYIPQLGRVVLTPVTASDGTLGVLLELQSNPPAEPVRFALTVEAVLDLSQKLAEIAKAPRTGPVPSAKH